MKGRRRQRQAYEFLKWVKEMEKELERVEFLWASGVMKNRDERNYYSEIEPSFCSDIEFRINTLRVIR